MRGKKWIILLLVLFLVWAGIGAVDYFRVSAFEKPLFCLPVAAADDGGSGRYVGLGYAFDIRGNFLPESEYPGVTEYVYAIFGKEVRSDTRD